MSQPNPVTADYYRWLFDYSYWARDRVLAQVSKLDQDGYVAPRALDYGTVRGTLVHWLARETIWLDRWEGRPDSSIGETDLPTLEALQERWTREEAKTKSNDWSLPFEQVHVLDITNGSRFETYAIAEAAGSRRVGVYGAAAHLVALGDLLIILAYSLTSDEAANVQPKVLVLGTGNEPRDLAVAAKSPG